MNERINKTANEANKSLQPDKSFRQLYGKNIMKWYPKMNYPSFTRSKQSLASDVSAQFCQRSTRPPSSPCARFARPSVVRHTLKLNNKPLRNSQQSKNNKFAGESDGKKKHAGFNLIRHNLLHLDVHTIDPIGSKDADDAFSVSVCSPVSTTLFVHICDPTSWIKSIDSECFRCAGSNGTSFYPSGQRTRRMFNKSIRELSSMRRGVRNAFTFAFEFTHKHNNPGEDAYHAKLNAQDFSLNDIVLKLSSVRCEERHEHSYESASIDLYNKCPMLLLVQKLTTVLRQSLSDSTCQTISIPVAFGEMEYLNLSTPKLSHNHGRVIMCRDSPAKVEVKRIIAIMATAVNGVVANVLHTTTSHITAYIDRSISLYTHFSSPLRRFSDCMLHFELKRVMHMSGHFDSIRLSELQHFPTDKQVPYSIFPMARMQSLLQKSKRAVAQQQILHQRSIQFRCMQYIYQRLNLDGARRVRVKFRTGATKNGYMKLYFTMIDGHHVRVQHVVQHNKMKEEDSTYELSITECNKPYNQFNDGVLPQIEEMFYSKNP